MGNIYKLIPLSLFDIPGLEYWLEAQANQGLFPEHLGSYASFRKDGVPGTRFRLEPFGKLGLEPAPEQLELYGSFGWEYAFSIGRTYFLFYTTNPESPELYTDYATRGQSLDRMAKQVRRAKWSRWIFPAVLLILLLSSFFLQSKYDVQPNPGAQLTIILISLFSPIFLLFIAVTFFSTPIQNRDYRTLLGIHNCLKQGLPPPPSPGPSKKIARENGAMLILAPLLVLILAGSWWLTRPIPLENFSSPYISLHQLESQPLDSWQNLFGYSRHNEDDNQAEHTFSLLAPVHYSVNQSLYEIDLENSRGFSPVGGEYVYAPDLELTYFHLLIPAMARPVAQAGLDQMRLVNVRWSYGELSYPGLDFVILASEPTGIWQMAAIAKGGRVAVFRYGGQELLSEHLDLLSEMVVS